MKRLFASLLTPILAMAVGLVLLAVMGFGDVKHERKDASDRIAGEIARHQLHKVYVSDFLEASGVRSDKGCYFASVFSTGLKDQAKDFEILNRIEVQRVLAAAGISAANLQNPESLSKLSTATGADAMLFGTLNLDRNHAALSLSLREASTGRELYQMEYREDLNSFFEPLFPAATSTNGQFFYFIGLDGVTAPKCAHCPQPEYTDAARRVRIEGTASFSVIFTESGKLKDVRVVRSLDPTLDQAAIAAFQKWSVNPAKDSAGNPVPVRLLVEVSIHLYK